MKFYLRITTQSCMFEYTVHMHYVILTVDKNLYRQELAQKESREID